MQTSPFEQNSSAVNLRYDDVVERYYRPLFQFALSLTRSEADACDLTQHTFYVWGAKGEQLRDASKVRAWLFTTMHRAFLERKRRESRFTHHELDEVDSELPSVSPSQITRLDSADVLDALSQIDTIFREPLVLFYLEDCPYKEIAVVLNVPIGTVKSRIARGIAKLQELLVPEYGRGKQPASDIDLGQQRLEEALA